MRKFVSGVINLCKIYGCQFEETQRKNFHIRISFELAKALLLLLLVLLYQHR